jgi:hypothetical protein
VSVIVLGVMAVAVRVVVLGAPLVKKMTHALDPS